MFNFQCCFYFPNLDGCNNAKGDGTTAGAVEQDNLLPMKRACSRCSFNLNWLIPEVNLMKK